MISLLVILSGCSPFRGITMAGSDDRPVALPAFADTEKVTYKAILTVRGVDYSGLMMIKAVEDEYRIAFFSEVGMSYLEGSLQGESYPRRLACRTLSPFLSSRTTLKDLEAALNLLLAPPAPMSGDSEHRPAGTDENSSSSFFFQSRRGTIFLTLIKI